MKSTYKPTQFNQCKLKSVTSVLTFPTRSFSRKHVCLFFVFFICFHPHSKNDFIDLEKCNTLKQKKFDLKETSSEWLLNKATVCVLSVQVGDVSVCFRLPGLCGYFIQECVCSAACSALNGRFSGGARGELQHVSVIAAQPRFETMKQEGVNWLNAAASQDRLQKQENRRLFISADTQLSTLSSPSLSSAFGTHTVFSFLFKMCAVLFCYLHKLLSERPIWA